MKHHSPMLLLVTVLVALFMVTPIVLSVLAGLVNNYSQGLSSGLTTRWLVQVWEGYGNTVWASLALAASCVLGTALMGVPCAYALATSKSRWARAFEELITLPVAVPGLATALALANNALSSHLHRLESAGYVELRRGFLGRKPRTRVVLTAAGRAAWLAHLDRLG